ncbi:hypothetical protein NDU88_002463 [Pleurodeles waltl]|uniref:Uncharacterized protein n=1 Tax=Pleurodeles waltl TaxID=8319 RepID=A0AAV7T201_PLEWA|nr:hypothetical protein NDU88_002463 [Pleurodeles waltl]
MPRACFLTEVEMPKLGEVVRASLGEPIPMEEILTSIQLLKTAKTPGSDCLPAKFYNKYADKLADRLQERRANCNGGETGRCRNQDTRGDSGKRTALTPGETSRRRRSAQTGQAVGRAWPNQGYYGLTTIDYVGQNKYIQDRK